MTRSEREPQAEEAAAVAVEDTASAPVTPPSAPSRSGYTATGERTAQSINDSLQAWADRQDTVTSCVFCDWEHVGVASVGREAALDHRREHHPEACIRKPRRRRRITKKKLRSAGEEEQIKVDAAEANRVRRERELADMLAKVDRGRERAGVDSDAPVV